MTELHVAVELRGLFRFFAGCVCVEIGYSTREPTSDGFLVVLQVERLKLLAGGV